LPSLVLLGDFAIFAFNEDARADSKLERRRMRAASEPTRAKLMFSFNLFSGF